MRALRELGGGGLIAMPSADSRAAAETVADIERYYRSATMTARDRIALLKVMWDLVGSEFGGRQLQYEMFASAAQHIADIQAYRAFDWRPGRAYVRRLLDSD
jgi:4-hydroxyphenylacetate 3-monooxygenase